MANERNLFGVFVAALTGLAMSAVAHAQSECGDSPFLEIDYRTKQENPQYCWAAVAAMAASYVLDESVDQCAIEEARESRKCCSGADVIDRQCGSAGYPDFENFNRIKIEKQKEHDALSPEELKRQLTRDPNRNCKASPVPFVWCYHADDTQCDLRNDPKHALLAAGYLIEDGNHYVFVADPNRRDTVTEPFPAGRPTIEKDAFQTVRPVEQGDRSIILHAYFVAQKNHHSHLVDYTGIRASGGGQP